MLTLADADGDATAPSIRNAISVVNSGIVDFSDYFPSISSSSQISLEVNNILNHPNSTLHTWAGAYTPANQNPLNQAAAIWINPTNPQNPPGFSSQQNSANVLFTTLHEILHASPIIHAASRQTLTGVLQDINASSTLVSIFSNLNPADQTGIRASIEESVVRATIEVIDIAIGNHARSGPSGFTNVATIVSVYGSVLSTAQQRELVTLIEANLILEPVRVGGSRHVRDGMGNVFSERVDGVPGDRGVEFPQTVFLDRSDGRVGTIITAEGEIVSIPSHLNYTENQLTHYGRFEHNDEGNLQVTSGSFGQSLGGFLRSFADAIGLDGRFGLQGSFSRPGEGLADPNSHSGNSVGNPNSKFAKPLEDDGGYNHNPNSDLPSKKSKPILLDLDGSGLSVTELDASTVYTDTTNDGRLNRTAWAGAGDGVLFFDADGNGQIGLVRRNHS